MNKKKLILIIGATIILLITVLVITYFIKKDNDSNNNEEEITEIKKIDEMDNYDYYLEETATEYYKELYDELKNTLNQEEVDVEEYAKIISKLFVTDLFTLDNKITSNDIGGLQFIYTDFKDDFINIAKTSIYSNVESNIYGDRTQELPIVTKVEISDIKNSIFNYQNNEYNSYEILVNIEYQKDLEYPKEYKLTLINNDKYLQVVKGE